MNKLTSLVMKILGTADVCTEHLRGNPDIVPSEIEVRDSYREAEGLNHSGEFGYQGETPGSREIFIWGAEAMLPNKTVLPYRRSDVETLQNQ